MFVCNFFMYRNEIKFLVLYVCLINPRIIKIKNLIIHQYHFINSSVVNRDPINMFKICFVILLFCSIAVIQIKAQERAMCLQGVFTKLEGCECVSVYVLKSLIKVEICPNNFTKREDGLCVRTIRSPATCESSQKTTHLGADGCVCL